MKISNLKKPLKVYLWHDEDENVGLAIFWHTYQEALYDFYQSDMWDWSDNYIEFKQFINKDFLTFKSLRKKAPEWAKPWVAWHEWNERCLREWIYHSLDENIICEICWEKYHTTYYNEEKDKLCCASCDD